MMARMIRAHGRRVGDGDPADLAELVALRAELDRAIREAIHGQREQHGFSWAEVAMALGTSRQSAFERYRDPVGA